MRSISLALLLLFGLPSPAPAQDPPLDAATSDPDFPASWYGVWKGECANLQPGRPARGAFEMELHVEPTEDPRRTRWAIVYRSGGNEQLRDYELIEIDAAAGRYEVDERNEIVLAASRVGEVVHQLFAIGGSTLHVRWQRQDEALNVEMASFGEPQATGPRDSVQSFPLGAVQQGVLHRNPAITVFEDVSVVPMDRERILEHHDVVVRDGRIVDLHPHGERAQPPGARRISGEGRYLMPGLADMHVHANGESDLMMFIAHGVTSVRNMWGMDRQLEWQQRVEAESDFFSPWIYTTGPIVDGAPPIWNGSVELSSPEQAREEVARQAAQGFPMVKVYNRLEAEVYDAIVEACEEHGLRVVGHVPDAVGLEAALDAGQSSIEHLSGYLDFQGRVQGDLGERVSATVEAGTWNCPTHVVHHKIAHMDQAAALLAEPVMRFVDPITRAMWDPKNDFRFSRMTETAYEAMRQGLQQRLELIVALRDGGGRLLLGSDTPNPFVVQGHALLEELQFFVDAGLSPYEALAAGTVDAAEFLEEQGEFGTIEIGARADLVLLSSDPLESVAHVRERVGVMMRGHWFSESELRVLLEERAQGFEEAAESVPSTVEELPPMDGAPVFDGHYELRWNDSAIGSERVAVTEDDATRHLLGLVQLNFQGPQASTTRCELEGDRCVGYSLRYEQGGTESTLSATLQGEDWALAIDSGSPEARELDPRALPWDSSIAATWAWLERLAPLEVEQRIEVAVAMMDQPPSLDLKAATFSVQRLADRASAWQEDEVQARVYELTTPHARCELLLHPDGWPLELHQHEQIGALLTRRTR